MDRNKVSLQFRQLKVKGYPQTSLMKQTLKKLIIP